MVSPGVAQCIALWKGSARQERGEHALELTLGSCSITRDAQRGKKSNSGEYEDGKYWIVGKILRPDIGMIQRRVF